MVLAAHAPRALVCAVLCAMLAAISGCGSAPPRASGSVVLRPGPAAGWERDGPDANPPADLDKVPDAQPQLESIRKGGPNKPYEALGREYVPITDDRPFSERGLASWYGRKFHGHRTSSGEPYDMYAMTAAHPTLPIPSYVRVRNPANAREVIVRVNDRGPFHPGRVVDLSYTAAYKLGLLRGVAPVELTRITYDEIRAGTWRRDVPSETPRPDASGWAASTAPSAAPRATDAGGLPAPASVASSTTASIDAGQPAAAGTVMTAAPTTAEAPTATPSFASNQIPATATAASSAAVAGPADSPPAARPAVGFWVQLGVFRQREGADGFSRRIAAELDWLAPVLAVFNDPSLYRLQAGPYANRDEAQGVAARVRRSLNLVPVIVERR